MLNNDWFQNPPVEFRAHPFWFWNGDMEESEILRQIGEMKAKGVGGFFVCARQGMTVPYLSQHWFDKVKFTVKAAEEAGLNVWLYDEYPYPSGIAGGEVTLEHPETKQRMLSRTAVAANAGQEIDLNLPWGKVLSARAVSLSSGGAKQWEHSLDISRWIGSFQDETVFQQTGSTNYSRKRYFTYHTVKKLKYKLPAGTQQWEIIVIIEQEVDDFKYFGTFVDPLHPQAVDAFMRMTHERYTLEMGEYFGGTIKGMFTDEIGLRAGKIPWSPMIPPFFQERYGYNLLDKLHHLYEDAGEDTAKVRYDFYQCIHLMLRENFHKKVADWCDDYSMEYVAEVPGVRMTTQLYSHIPGGDSAHEKLGRTLSSIMQRYAHSLRHNPKMGSSLARQLGRKRALIECFHSIGWSMTLQDARWMIDWMAVMGTNMFNFHAFFYSIDGLRKHDAAPSQFEQNPYWKHFGQLGDYIGRLSYIMSEGKAKIDIAVLDPTTSLWTQMGNPFHQFSFAGTNAQDKQRLERMKSDWIEIQTALLIHQRDYDTLDPEMLLQAEIGEGALHIGAGSYKVLIIPPVSNLEAAAWKRIQMFTEAGGTVISVGLLPYETIEPQSGTLAEMASMFHAEASDADYYWNGPQEKDTAQEGWRCGAEGAFFVPFSSGSGHVHGMKALTGLLNWKLPRAVEVMSDDGQTECLLMQHRKLSDQSDIIFIANHEGLEKKVLVHLKESYFGSGYQLIYRDLENGETRPLSSEGTANGRKVTLSFAPYQSHLIEIIRDYDEQALSFIQSEQEQPEFHIQVVSNTDWEVELTEPNLLRLGRFQMALDPGDAGLEQMWHLTNGEEAGVKWFDVDAKTWISQCADHAGELQHSLSYSSHWFGTPFQVKIDYPVVCWYKTTFDVEHIPESVELQMDREAILGAYRLFVNGLEWDGGQVPLVAGENTIMIRVLIKHSYEGVVDPLYLRGPFGVRFSKERHPIITALPAIGNPNHAVVEGFPYYSGTFIFRRPFHIPVEKAGSGKFELSLCRLNRHFHDCAEALVNGHSLGVRSWTPYVWTGQGEWLAPGANNLELRVDNTLSLRLDGTYFDYALHQIKETSAFHYDTEAENEPI
ncbi:MAG: hypothetical protein K0S39_790 [Paenibacillus sp.]|jgi:hypothetical protein|nr:hypothetical protein [Paenibacillus sp.]